jgi:hypothetical protein
MKKATFLLVFSAFATAAFAQTTPSTEVKVRDNGTTKVVTKTGKTNTGQAIDNTKDAAGNVAKKTGSAIKRGAKKTTRAVKRGTQKMGNKTVKATEKIEAKTE